MELQLLVRRCRGLLNCHMEEQRLPFSSRVSVIGGLRDREPRWLHH